MATSFVPEGGLEDGYVDPRVYAFENNLGVETTIAKNEMIILPPDNIQNPEFIDFTLPLQNDIFYDLQNSFFQFDVQCATFYSATQTPLYNDDNSWSTQSVCFPAPFHSVLRFIDMDIFFGNQRVSDKCFNNMFAFKEFAKHSLNTSGSQIDLKGTYDGTLSHTSNTHSLTDETAATGITSFDGGSATLGFGAWEKFIFKWITTRNSEMSVIFKPQDGFWNMLKFVPASIPIKIRIYKRLDTAGPGPSNANYWSLCTGPATTFTSTVGYIETPIGQHMWLKQIFPTNSALTLYKSLYTKYNKLIYNVQHAETTTFQVVYGNTTETAHGMFTSRKPQTVFIHVIPTSNLNSKTRSATIHPFANLSQYPNPIPGRSFPFGANPYARSNRNLMKSVVVSYGGRKYPRTWDYQRDTAGTGGLQSTIQDYQEYVKQTMIYNKFNPDNHIPLISDDVYCNNQLFVLCYSLQDNGDTFQDRKYSQSTRGSLSVTVNFLDGVTENMTIVVTGFSNEIITVDENNVVSKSY